MNVKLFSTFFCLSICYTTTQGVYNGQQMSIAKAPFMAIIEGYSIFDGAKMYSNGAILSEWVVLTHGMHQA